MINLLSIWQVLVAFEIALFLSYTLIMYIFSKKKVKLPEIDYLPTITLLIPVYNEEKIIKEKIENTSQLDYPKDRLKIMLLDDHLPIDSIDGYRQIMPKIIAIIPACGGSKHLLRKNIKLLLGKPLIAWTIEKAKRSKYINKVVVSTEDEEIAEISKEYGAEVIERPKEELAKGETPTIDVIIELLRGRWGNEN
jgi:cellulose synthase/poly-beta-1,6-N-acetylglucosamine synthase-like glycosyltransferase